MSFTLRQITHRAGAGEIVRTRSLATATISVGRGADQDLQLADLAVGLRHAQMTQTGLAQVTVEAAAGQAFEADGRFTNSATLDVSRKPRLILGSHVLCLCPGAAPDEIVVTAERLAGAAAKAGDEEVRTFSPGAAGLSKRATAWVLGGLIAAVCLALPIAAFYAKQNARIQADRQWSSGPLSKVHAFLEKDCQSCHQHAFVAVRDQACLSCHQANRPPSSQQAVIARVRAWGGPGPPVFVNNHADPIRMMRATPLPEDLPGKAMALFRRAFNHPNTRCASCHREHLDADGHAIAAGLRSGGPTRDKPALTPVQDCAQCHGGMKARLPDAALVDTPSWRGHPDFRPLVTLSPAPPRPTVRRIAMERQPQENPGVTFPHGLHLAPEGGVARWSEVLGVSRGYGGPLNCASCHRPDASGQGFRPVEMTRDCSACHSLAFARVGGKLTMLPHGNPGRAVSTLAAYYGAGREGRPSHPSTWPRRPPGMAADAKQRGVAMPTFGSPSAIAIGARKAFSAGGNCYDCHRVLRPARPNSPAYGIAPVHLAERYLPRGGFNHAIPAHRRDAAGRERCGSCHKAQASGRAEDLLLPRIDQCAACHGKTRAETPHAAGADCAQCHSYHSPGRPARKGKLVVQRTALAPRGAG